MNSILQLVDSLRPDKLIMVARLPYRLSACSDASNPPPNVLKLPLWFKHGCARLKLAATHVVVCGLVWPP